MNQITGYLSGFYNLYKESFSGLSRNVWILATALFINRSGSTLLLFISLYLTRDLGFSLSEAGSIVSFYGLGSILGAYLGGWFTDKTGFYRVMLISLILGGLVLLIIQFVSSYWAIASVVFSFSLIADSFRPANVVAIGAMAKPENKTRSLSLMRLATNLGYAVGPAIGGILAVSLGYKFLFFLDSLTCIAAAIVLMIFLPVSKQNIPAVGLKKDSSVKSLSAYRDVKFMVFILMVTVYAMVFFQLFTTVPVYMRDVLNYREDFIGFLIGLNGFLIVIMEMPAVLKMEKYPFPMKLIAYGCFMMGISYLFMTTGHAWIALPLTFIFLLTISEILSMPFMLNYAIARPGPDRQGQYMALYSIAYGAAHILAPGAGMWIADHYGFQLLYIIAVVISLVLGIGFLMVRRKSLKISRLIRRSK